MDTINSLIPVEIILVVGGLMRGQEDHPHKIKNTD